MQILPVVMMGDGDGDIIVAYVDIGLSRFSLQHLGYLGFGFGSGRRGTSLSEPLAFVASG